MRLILGLILGAVLTVGGAFVHDNYMDSGTPKPLVNWTNVSEFQQSSFDYVVVQFNRLKKWATSE
jgi:hypothetical protein